MYTLIKICLLFVLIVGCRQDGIEIFYKSNLDAYYYSHVEGCMKEEYETNPNGNKEFRHSISNYGQAFEDLSEIEIRCVLWLIWCDVESEEVTTSSYRYLHKGH